MRSSSVLAFRAPAQRSDGVRKCRGCARGPTTTAASAAALVSRGCSPGESGVAGLAAAAAPVARAEPTTELVPFVAAGARAQTGGSQERLAAARAQRRAAPGAGRVRNPTTVRGCFYAEATNRQHGFVNATASGEIYPWTGWLATHQ